MGDEIESVAEVHRPVRARLGERLRAFGRRHPGWIGLTLVLIVGLAARVVLSMRDGHLADVNLFLGWMRALAEHGLGGFYEAGTHCNYPPLHVLTLRGLGELLSVYDPELANAAWLRAWLRGPACLADVLITLLLYVEVRRLVGTRTAVAAGALYFLNPVSLYNSAYWGQVDSIHSAFVLLALVGLNRRRDGLAGAAMALALLQKLQSIVFVPLILFDVYRWRRGRGLGRCAIGAAIAAVVVLAPFAATGSLRPALRDGYSVVGQYRKLSVNAFNLWGLADDPAAPDDAVPTWLVELAAGDEVEVAEDAGWLMRLTARNISMILFVLGVALTLSAYSRRHTAAARSLAAGVLGLVFFFLLTEMHERYAYPVIAVLPIWAVTGAWKERAYLLVSVLMLLNLTVAQGVDQIGGDISGLNLVLMGLFFGALLLTSKGTAGAGMSAATVPPERFVDPAERPAPSAVVAWFVRVTIIATIGVIAVAAVIGWQYRRSVDGRSVGAEAAGVLYLGDLTPTTKLQGYGRLRVDRSVEGGPIRLGGRYFLRGVGTHAPSTLTYDLPEGFGRFRAVAGVDRHGYGRVELRVYLDEKQVLATGPLTRDDEPVSIDVPLDGAGQLTLSAKALGSKKGDHVDWGLARVEK
ncbi:MAG TPA: NPCBM/NEW2 domain-containing protein [Phycisphaerae bacterium]|nr:NPCBM/NEW2 domain-containing protein [Phycisphaerae bacterium]